MLDKMALIFTVVGAVFSGVAKIAELMAHKETIDKEVNEYKNKMDNVSNNES